MPMKVKLIRAAVIAAFLPAFVAGCSPSTASPTAKAPANAVVAQAAGELLPFDENDPLFGFFRHFRLPVPKQAPMRGVGSGFIVSPDGYVLTNAHVVDGAREVDVKLTDRREFTAKVVGTDRNSDIALLKIEAKDLPVVRIGHSQDIKVGQWVVAMGSPFGFENSVTAGIISAKSRSLPGEGYVPFI
ncbi:MAG: trypsin-like serine protease, partial [Betaproteobacteria bacterium]